MAASAIMCAAQQNTTGTNDLSNLQHQRLSGTADNTGSTTGNVTGRTTNPNNTIDNNIIAPTLMDLGAGTDQGNVGHFVTMSDKQFAQMLVTRSMMEIELGKMAAERGGSQPVKQIGQRMVDDYTQWSAGMVRAARGLGIKLPTQLDAKQRATVDRIGALSGPEFDSAYLKEVVSLQSKALTMAEHEAANAGVTGFRHFAGVSVPVIQEQIKEAKAAMTGSVASKR